MNRYMLKLFHFLGGVYFAIILIGFVALFVALGTFIEAYTGSHRHAALYTYQHPFFIALLMGFFINILFAALRRWPFHWKHFPFLVTHVGLLMILMGVIVKSYYGVQGNMRIVEGSGTDLIAISNSFSLHIEKRANDGVGLLTDALPMKEDWRGKMIAKIPKSSKFPHLKIDPIAYIPHAIEQPQSWLKGNVGYIYGFSPFLTADLDEHKNSLPVSSRLALNPSNKAEWNVIAGNTANVSNTIQKAFLQECRVLVSDAHTNAPLYTGKLLDTLKTPVFLKEGTLRLSLQLNFLPTQGFEEPSLIASLIENDMHSHSLPIEIEVPLSGSRAIFNKQTSTNASKRSSINIDLQNTPTLLLLGAPNREIYLCAFGPHGEVYCEQPSSIVMYDQGFGGYSQQAKIPCNILSRRECEEAFLKHVAQKMDWKMFSAKDLKTCHWMSKLFDQLEPRLAQGENFYDLLCEHEWPMVSQFQGLKTSEIFKLLAMQLNAVADQLPEVAIPEDQVVKAKLLQIYFQLRVIDLQELPEMAEIIERRDRWTTLESPLTMQHDPAAPLSKLEDNLPVMTFRMQEGKRVEEIALAYDHGANGLKWPIFQGKYLVRFQPHLERIPYRVRLRSARQVNQINSSQPYSYESDLIIGDGNVGNIETTLSMNTVYETWDGYRFYLANIDSGSDVGAKEVQIVVNHDPAKYYLTYPGAIVLSLGIFLLFWLQPYRKHGR